MSVPDLRISEEAQDLVREALASWPGESRDLALAMVTFGNAVLLILDGRTDHIVLYDAAAKAIVDASTRPALNG